MIAVSLLVCRAVAAAEEPAPDETPLPPEPEPPDVPPATEDAARYYPPPIDGPALRLPESPTRYYLDGTYAIASDLTALPYIAGQAINYRAAVGGAWRWRRFTFEGQLPFNVTTIDVTSVLNVPPKAEDAQQTSVSLGDLTLGAIWTERLTSSEALIAGLALRGRLATHTTRFDIHLYDGSLATFVIPYYFHIEPTVVLGGALGRFTYVMNQGVNFFIGPDGYVQAERVRVPSILFWDAHYAVGVAPWRFLGASVEFASMIQLNHIDMIPGLDVDKFNNIRAMWIAPALQVHLGSYRIDALARFGLTRGQETYGVLEYVGTHSFALRLTRYL